jgi:hypothetical protein
MINDDRVGTATCACGGVFSASARLIQKPNPGPDGPFWDMIASVRCPSCGRDDSVKSVDFDAAKEG